ncbi:flagellin [Cytobacillus firmus]|uniref:flagellin N-terminal helical domain-containing protein n=1 Tax=Cytobacillus firmus TaxID=1399 RepID=UPI001C9765B2|nr:flagellin [Cytobacillus firmus]MBY6052167.1 flagellin [Cytobacillus firmus]
MRINHNIAALNTYRQLNTASGAQSKSMEKLSSGMRINKAGDDAAGLAISEKMRAQVRGLDQASKNAQDGISLIQTAEGALNETHDILQRMRELAVQSSNDTNTTDDRDEIQKEIEQLKSEIDRISTDTEFNTQKLLDGSIKNKGTVSGTNTADITGVSIADDTLKAGEYTIDVSSSTVSSTLDSAGTTAIGGVTISGTNVKMGEYSLTLTENGSNFDAKLTDADGNVVAESFNQALDNSAGTETLAIGGLTFSWADGSGSSTVAAGTATVTLDADLTVSVQNEAGDVVGAKTFADNTTGKVSVGGFELSFDSDLTDSDDVAAYNTTVTVETNALSFQIGANSDQNTKLAINNMSSSALGVDDLDLTTTEGADAAITSLDAAIKSVSSERSKLGAIQNRLDHTINNLNTSSENLTAAESRIRDVDMAKEMMEQTKNSILSQAAQAMLAQANQQPQGVLQLLR